MQGFFNRMYNGKSNRPDFTPEHLPENRFQLFFDMLRMHLGQLVLLNLLNLLFLIPWMVWTWMSFSMMSITPESADGYFQYWLLLSPLTLLPYAPAAAGTAYITRNWARDEHTWLLQDFFANYKSNWKQSLGVCVIFGVFLNIAYIAMRFYAVMAGENLIWLSLQVLIIVLIVVSALALMLIFPIMAGYSLKLKELIRSAYALIGTKIYFAVPIGLAVSLPVILLLIPNVVTYLAAFAYFFVIGIGVSALISASYANYLFDSYINPRIDGAPMRKGLRPSDEELDAEFDDDEEDEEEDEEQAGEDVKAYPPGRDPQPAS